MYIHNPHASTLSTLHNNLLILISSYSVLNLSIMYYNFTLSIAVLTVQFSKLNFSALETSGFVPVTLLLGGGTSASDITVIVIPFDQSPVSAESKICVSFSYCY